MARQRLAHELNVWAVGRVAGYCHKLGVEDANVTFGADKQGDQEGTEVLELLEGVDDDMDRLGVGMVKISEASAAKYEHESCYMMMRMVLRLACCWYSHELRFISTALLL